VLWAGVALAADVGLAAGRAVVVGRAVVAGLAVVAALAWGPATGETEEDLVQAGLAERELGEVHPGLVEVADDDREHGGVRHRDAYQAPVRRASTAAVRSSQARLAGSTSSTWPPDRSFSSSGVPVAITLP